MQEQNMSKNKMIAIGAGIIIVILALFGLAKHFSSQNSTPTTETNTPAVSPESAVTTTYACENNFSINATFQGNGAQLSLSDGRAINVAEVSVGTTTGSRFENNDGSFALTTLGPTAIVEENGVVTHANCIEPKG